MRNLNSYLDKGFLQDGNPLILHHTNSLKPTTISTVKIIYMDEIKPDNKDFRIAELHVEGLSNPQIADALGINR